MVSLAARLNPPGDFFLPWKDAAVMAQYWTRAALLRTTALCQSCWACPTPELGEPWGLGLLLLQCAYPAGPCPCWLVPLAVMPLPRTAEDV